VQDFFIRSPNRLKAYIENLNAVSLQPSIHRSRPVIPTSPIRFKALCAVSILLATKNFSICLFYRFANSVQAYLSKLQIRSHGVHCDIKAATSLMYSSQELLPICASLLAYPVYLCWHRHVGAMDPFEKLLRVGGELPGLDDEISHWSRTEAC
jgi:hypothetical protein